MSSCSDAHLETRATKTEEKGGREGSESGGGAAGNEEVEGELGLQEPFLWRES
jgi:hypothetical protein